MLKKGGLLERGFISKGTYCTGDFFFLFILIKCYNIYLRSTLLTRITLQYYWDEYPPGSKELCLPQGD